jgi:hypothetical protein
MPFSQEMAHEHCTGLHCDPLNFIMPFFQMAHLLKRFPLYTLHECVANW